MWEYLQPTSRTNLSKALASWLASFAQIATEDPFSRVKRFTQHVFDSFEYQPGATHVESTIDQFLSKKAGVCQDYAHLMITVARSWGIPARYVSGYLYDADKQSLRAENATHAWVECWFPMLGWMPFDPTNAKIDDEDLITVGIGRDYHDVAPSRGITIGGGRSELTVGVNVSRFVVESKSELAANRASQQQ